MVLVHLNSLTLSLFALLTSLALAAPIEPEPMHRLPLRRISTKRDGEHPIMAFHRHQTAAIKRMHKFKRSTPPDDDFFRTRAMQRRQMVQNLAQLERRDPLWISSGSISDVNAPQVNDKEKRAWYPPANAGDAPNTVPVAAVNGAAKKGAAAATTAAAAAAPSITVAASGSNANGFDSTEFQALEDNTLTNSTTTLTTGGLDYVIEGSDIGYLAEVQMGTPAQTFLMLMDTGSSDTWVPSTACTAKQCGNHLALGSDSSSTFQASTQAFQVIYGSGAVAGTLAADTLSIAGMTLENHSMGVTTQETAQFSAATVPFDGLMGLGGDALSEQGVPTPIESLASNGLLKQAVMGIALGRVADGINDGEIVFGQADTAKLDASTTQTLPLSSTDGFWQVDMAAVNVGGTAAVTGRQAILDTGTSLMVAPIADATAFHAQINGAADAGGGMFTIPCTTDAFVTMQFGSATFQIDARDLLFQPVSNDLTGDCISSLSAGTVTDNVTWLLGDTFLKNVYMTTNVGASTVQLSARTDSPGSSSAAAAAAAAAGSSGSAVAADAVLTSSAVSASTTATAAKQASLIGALAALLAGGSNL